MKGSIICLYNCLLRCSLFLLTLCCCFLSWFVPSVFAQATSQEDCYPTPISNSVTVPCSECAPLCCQHCGIIAVSNCCNDLDCPANHLCWAMKNDDYRFCVKRATAEAWCRNHKKRRANVDCWFYPQWKSTSCVECPATNLTWHQLWTELPIYTTNVEVETSIKIANSGIDYQRFDMTLHWGSSNHFYYGYDCEKWNEKWYWEINTKTGFSRGYTWRGLSPRGTHTRHLLARYELPASSSSSSSSASSGSSATASASTAATPLSEGEARARQQLPWWSLSLIKNTYMQYLEPEHFRFRIGDSDIPLDAFYHTLREQIFRHGQWFALNDFQRWWDHLSLPLSPSPSLSSASASSHSSPSRSSLFVTWISVSPRVFTVYVRRQPYQRSMLGAFIRNLTDAQHTHFFGLVDPEVNGQSVVTQVKRCSRHEVGGPWNSAREGYGE
eukprot:TRINITY_DN10584_c0_g1_i1.p1 TRINITY_DN10584_c0_g1~~TRINITY_DN10584_c0_g1_i1.p1  ORF type:complete len:449 (-),score=81.97 TRINITY_DN10584_c0_g1_i1:206-1528(-)